MKVPSCARMVVLEYSAGADLWLTPMEPDKCRHVGWVDGLVASVQ